MLVYDVSMLREKSCEKASSSWQDLDPADHIPVDEMKTSLVLMWLNNNLDLESLTPATLSSGSSRCCKWIFL